MITRAILWCIITHRTSAITVHCMIGATCLIHTSFFIWLFNRNLILPFALFKNLQEKKTNVEMSHINLLNHNFRFIQAKRIKYSCLDSFPSYVIMIDIEDIEYHSSHGIRFIHYMPFRQLLNSGRQLQFDRIECHT